MAKPKLLFEAKMGIAGKGYRRKSIRRQSGRRKGDIEKIKTEKERGKEWEVTVRHEAVPPKKEKSAFSSLEEFTMEWSETFITKKRKKNPER